jgi:hypothetical protein
MIPDKTTTEEKLMNETSVNVMSLMKSDVVDAPTKKLIESFPAEFKDLILETVLKQIIDNLELKERFRKEIVG